MGETRMRDQSRPCCNELSALEAEAGGSGVGGETPNLQALLAELEDESEAAHLTVEELDEAALEAELALADDYLSAEIALSDGAAAAETAGPFSDLETEPAPLEGRATLDDIVAVAREYPGLKITLSF
jgi:hypothetical protein